MQKSTRGRKANPARTPTGERVRKGREALGVSQEQLAGMIGVARSIVSRYESGELTPSITAGRRLAAALGLTLDSLYAPGDSAGRKKKNRATV